MFPRYIILKTEDEDYIVGQLMFVDQLDTNPSIPVYKYFELYHELEQAIKFIEKKEKQR